MSTKIRAMLPVRAKQQMALAASTTAVHSACVTVASSGRIFCNLDDCPPLHLVCLPEIFRNLNHICCFHFVLDLAITNSADTSIKETPHSFNPSFFFDHFGVPSSPFFSCHVCEMISFLILISVNVLEHVQVISHRTNVCYVQHVVRLLHHHSELLIVDLPFPIHPTHLGWIQHKLGI